MTARIDLESWALPAVVAALAVLLGFTAGVAPQLAIGASFAVAFVILVVTDLVWGLAVFTFFAFLEIVPFGGPALSVTKLLGGLLLISWLMSITSGRRAWVAWPLIRRAAVLLTALVGWTLLSATWAEQPGTALSSVSRLALNAIMFVIVLTAVTKRRDLIRLVAAFVAGATIAALYGIAAPGQFEADFGRLESAALDPNELAALLIPALLICIFVAVGFRKPVTRLLAGGLAGICGLTILLTVSRGGLVAAFAALGIACLVAGRWRWRMMLVAGTVLASGFIYFAGFASQGAVDHLQSTTQGNERLTEGRLTIWQVAWRMAEANPVHGVGAGNFSNTATDYVLVAGNTPRTDFIVDKAAVVHNTFLGTLTELGIIGLSLLLVLIALCLGSLLRAARIFKRIGDSQMEVLSRALFAGLAGILVASFFISNEYSKALWLMLSLGPTTLSVARRMAAGDGPAAA